MKKTESAGAVLLNSEGLVLVVNQHGTSWSLPKGHIETGEDKLVAAKREIFEESGIKKLKITKELGNYTRYKLDKMGNETKEEFKKIYIFLMHTNEVDLKPIDPENPEARWVSKEDVSDLLTHPKDKAFFLSILGDIK